MFTPANFLIRLKDLVSQTTNGAGSGVGFYRTVPLPLGSFRTSGNLTLTAATNPLVAALETNFLGVQWAAGDSTKMSLNWVVPDDYDKNTDIIKLNYLCNSAANTDSPTLTVNVYRKRAGTALTADLAPSATSAIAKSATAATAAAVRTVTISAKGLQAGDVLSILVAPGTHATDAVNLYSVSLRYPSTLVDFDPTTR